MKKLFIFITCIFMLLISKNVYAYEILTREYQGNLYYYRTWSDDFDTDRLNFYYLNGEVAYCIEPGVHLTDNTYIEVSNDYLPFNNEVLEKIKLIGYYGYEYPGHSNNNYKMATQSLIWETVKNMNVSFYTGKNKTGSLVDVSNEKNEIMNLVNNHYVKPNYNDDLILSIDKDNVLYDSNNVLDNYEIINDNDNLEVYKDGNNLHIKSTNIGDYEIILRKIKYDNKSTLLYVGSDMQSQKLMKLRYDTLVELKINIHIVSGKINLEKKNKDNNDNNKIGNTTLEGAKYQIYDENNNMILELITNDLGISSASYLPFGNYYLKEITPSYGYLKDLNKYDFTIDSNNLDITITSYEELIKKNITIVKTIEGDYSLLDGEENIEFEIYLDNNLYDKIITNKDGVARINLPYGNYTFHQLNTKDGYIKSDDFSIKVDENTNDLIKVIYDKRVLGKIKIIKSDLENDQRLENALIDIYKDSELIYSDYTNKDGLIELDNLLVGEYKIVERMAPNDYILDDKEYIVNITNDNNDIVLDIKNKHMEIQVPNTGSNKNMKLKYISTFNILIGIFMIIYRKKIITK